MTGDEVFEFLDSLEEKHEKMIVKIDPISPLYGKMSEYCRKHDIFLMTDDQQGKYDPEFIVRIHRVNCGHYAILEVYG